MRIRETIIHKDSLTSMSEQEHHVSVHSQSGETKQNDVTLHNQSETANHHKLHEQVCEMQSNNMISDVEQCNPRITADFIEMQNISSSLNTDYVGSNKKLNSNVLNSNRGRMSVNMGKSSERPKTSLKRTKTLPDTNHVSVM